MKRHLLTTTFLIALGLATPLASAHAGNSKIEATLQSYGDLSMFYQGLLNTGVINEMREGEHYTIFAPVNQSFAQIARDRYPCFYSEQCRPQIATVMRNHILLGRYDEKDLVTYGNGVEMLSGRIVHPTSPYVGDYAVDGHTILSESEVDGNIIYRINGVIATPPDLTPFQNVSYVSPAPGDSVTTERTVVRKTYRTTAAPEEYPAGTMAPGVIPNDGSQTTTVVHTYTTESP